MKIRILSLVLVLSLSLAGCSRQSDNQAADNEMSPGNLSANQSDNDNDNEKYPDGMRLLAGKWETSARLKSFGATNCYEQAGEDGNKYYAYDDNGERQEMAATELNCPFVGHLLIFNDAGEYTALGEGEETKGIFELGDIVPKRKPADESGPERLDLVMDVTLKPDDGNDAEELLLELIILDVPPEAEDGELTGRDYFVSLLLRDKADHGGGIVNLYAKYERSSESADLNPDTKDADWPSASVPPPQRADLNANPDTKDGRSSSAVQSIAAGLVHTVGLKNDRTVAAVGADADGMCDVGNWQDIIAISAGGYHTVGLLSGRNGGGGRQQRRWGM